MTVNDTKADNRDEQAAADETSQETGNQPVENKDQWCFAWVVPPPGSGKTRAALVKDSKWAEGDVITISFLDGDPDVQEKVKNAAMEWVAPGMANLQFKFQDDTDSLVRISFQYEGSWSVIGTTCKQLTDVTEPTMNFGWLTPDSTEEEVRRVVLHEFGHALGLIHEHQNPAGGIKWNKPQVIRDLSEPPNSWPLEVIEQNMFDAYEKDETNYTRLDPNSIMMYPIPETWTTNGFSVGLNSELSKLDKKFISQQYQ